MVACDGEIVGYLEFSTGMEKFVGFTVGSWVGRNVVKFGFNVEEAVCLVGKAERFWVDRVIGCKVVGTGTGTTVVEVRLIVGTSEGNKLADC